MLALVPGGGGGDGAARWLCTCWRQVAGVGCRVQAGAVSWLRTWWRQVAGAGAGGRRYWCWCWALAVHVVETGCRVLGATDQPPLLTVKCQQSWAA